MTPWETRESYLDSILTEEEIEKLKQSGLFPRYVYGEISIEDIYAQLREEGI